MSRQKHRIMRQVLEIRGCPSDQAWHVQNEIRRIYYQRIVPLMETSFAGVSSPDRILRINTLEIDLGEVPLDALEHALCSEFENVFARELAAAISQAQKAFGSVEDVTLASQLELFSYYLKTGAVPWWADLARRNLLEENLEFLIQQAPVALAEAMQELGNQERVLRRIVLSYPDHLLDGLSCVLAPGLWAAFPGFTRELAALLQTAASVSKSRSPSLGRTVLWEETLRLANTRDVSALEPFSFFRGIFMRLAHRSGVAYRSLISDIDEGLKAGSSKVHPRAAAIVQSLYREICPATAESGPEAESMHAELVELLERFDGSGPSTADLRVRLRAILDRLPPSSLAQALAKLKLWLSRAAGGETLTSELIDELAGPGPLSAPTPLSPASTPASVDHQLRLKTGFTKVHPRAAAIVQSLYREICSATAEFGPEAESIHAELVELLERFDGSGPSTADLRVRLRTILDRLPPSSLAQALAKLELWLSRAAGDETLTSELIDELAGPGPPSAPTPSLSPASTPASVDHQLESPMPEISQPGSEGGAEVVLRPEPYPAKRTPPTPPNAVESWKKPIDLSFSDSDELYVNNSGLVILWPFLVRFFERLGLLEERRFKDVAATHRAVRLSQYLADPQQEPPPEYLLLLNKVLCGMPVDEVFDFGLPLTEHEIEECHSLLTAVIEQAPVLHNMSVAGFRATFLLRRGQLSTRDGAWLLRVERETYDLVLDRFPWSIAWLKLPWMEDPMQVEW
jgi:hypothetical protein